MQFTVFEKIYWAYLFQIAHEKSCDYVLIIYLKRYEIAYHNYAVAKRAHQVQKSFIQTLQVTLCVWSKQRRTIKTIAYNDVFTSLRRKKVQIPAKQFKELFSLVCYFFTLN